MLSRLFISNLVVIQSSLTLIGINFISWFLYVFNFKIVIVICNYNSVIIIINWMSTNFILGQTLIIEIDCSALFLWLIYPLLYFLRLINLGLLIYTLINASFILFNRSFNINDCLFWTFQTAFKTLYWLLMS